MTLKIEHFVCIDVSFCSALYVVSRCMYSECIM